MTSMFDFSNFDAKDAAIIGGVMGFAEESMREENQELEDLEDTDLEELLLDKTPDRDASLAAFKRYNPELYRKIVHTIILQRARWAQERRDFEQVKGELLAMERCEAMLKEEDR